MRIKNRHKDSKKELLLMAAAIFFIACLVLISSYFRHKVVDVTSVNENEATVDQIFHPDFTETVFDISINNIAYKRLSLKRKEALKKGLLFSSKEDLVDADIKIDGKEYACKLRLKGDLLDHLRGDRWSFRILLKDGKKWNGMNVFSIHNSKARSHTAEWLMHELFRKEGIIVPDYDFIRTKVNGKDLGVYAYEHHFENEMLKKNERELGPILKHNDDSYWDNVLSKPKPFPWIEASHIELFNKDNLSDPEFEHLTKVSIAMLGDFLNEEKRVDEVFDIDLMAKYYALLDLSHAWHAQQFTNIRFYLNPTSGKLEPIAFDCFGDYLPNVNSDWEAFGEGFNSGVKKEEAYERSNVYQYHMLQDDNFFRIYMKYLNEFTDSSYLEEFKRQYVKPLQDRSRLIQSDTLYKEFKPKFDQLFAKAKFTNKKLKPLSNLALKAYRINGSKQNIELQSFHSFPLEVIGVGSELSITEALNDRILLESYNPKVPVNAVKLNASQAVEYVYYQVLGLEEVYKIKVLKDGLPLKNVITAKPNLEEFLKLPFVSKRGNQINIQSGKHIISRRVVVPQGYNLIFSPGSQLIFKNGGNFCSYSSIQARGTKEQPIVFDSEGAQGSGLLLIDSDEESKFEYCQFMGLASYQANNINTKGAVSIYNSNAAFFRCNFKRIKAKESLGLRKSVVSIKECTFDRVQGTAISSHYSNLYVDILHIDGVGNNGISVSSGNLEAKQVVIKNALNRALNFTENAKAYLYKVDLYDCYQSFYANDHANVKLVKFWNQNIQKGIELRSGELSHAKVVMDEFNYKDVDQLFLIKQGLFIMVNGKKEKG